MTPSPFLVASNICKRFAGAVAVANASISINQGSCHGLVGANGAGKSTLMKIFAGQVQADSGSIVVEGCQRHFQRPVDAQRAGIALMPQELTLAPHLSVAENVMLGQEPNTLGVISRRALRMAAQRNLERLDLRDYPLNTVVAALPPVDQRLLMTARALTFGPRLLMLDEPTAAMLPTDAIRLAAAIRRIIDSGTSVLYVSHRLDEIVEMCDRVTVMRDARVIAELETHEIERRLLIDLVSPVEQSVVRQRSERSVNTDKSAINRLNVQGIDGRGFSEISFEIPAGEIIGVAGLAGSGAEEILLAIAGASPRWGGSITLDGIVVPPTDRVTAASMGVGYLPGDRTHSAMGRMSIRTNVTLPAVHRFSRRGVVQHRKERIAVEEVLASVALLRDPEIPINTLSGGNQQKALVGRWVSSEAKLLLLAEPTAGIDAHAREEIHSHLLELCRTKGLTVLISSTDHDELAALCDWVIGLDRGKICGELRRPGITTASILSMLTGGAPIQSTSPETISDVTLV